MTELEKDYFCSGMSIKEIAEKHNLTTSQVSALKNKYKKPSNEWGNTYKIQRVLVFNEIDMDRIEALLKESNIKYEIPFDCTIEFQSKLNTVK